MMGFRCPWLVCDLWDFASVHNSNFEVFSGFAEPGMLDHLDCVSNIFDLICNTTLSCVAEVVTLCGFDLVDLAV